jgi:hypothetical protein
MSTEHPTGALATPLGVLDYTMTKADHVFLHTERHSESSASITINRIPYHCSFHVHLIKGEWTVNDWHEPYLHRLDTYGEPTNAARKKAREVLIKAWTSYLSDHPSLIRKAALSHAAGIVAQLTSELDGLKEKTAAKAVELQEAKKVLDSI